uniref:Transcriptional regulator n=1 Tax=Parastrongyloides trichosuri TaxID=131310 RepID=A0A0N5A6V6_PARTI
MKLVYDTLLSTPGMSEVVKLDLRINRKQILLITQLLEKGLELKDDAIPFHSTLEEPSIQDLIALILDKSGLTEMATHLKLLFKN